MVKNKHILVVEDEAITRAKLVGYFQHEGYQVSEAQNKDQLDAIMAQHPIDLVMLDINLPGEDGLVITRKLRAQSNVGIILVTGRTDTIDKIVGLEMGADDYVTKPFELRELLVRVKNLLWRVSLAKNEVVNQEQVDDDAFYFGPWRFDIPRRKLSNDGNVVKLTKAEYEILVAFIAHPGRVLSRDRLLNLIDHRVDDPNDRTIDVLIRRLRSKIELDPKDPQYFVTVHGEGYLFAAELS
ncbi:MAG: two-component system response regulator TorR [Gammaproteobacteria bacterium]|nr:two-component system response regulator TorR [Gammaproteobacteria bacterium]